jgi:glutathione S-transferase
MSGHLERNSEQRAEEMNVHELTLFGVGTSRTMRAHWMLLELGLDYESRPIQSRSGETLTDQFRLLNPRHKIPVLQHGSLVLTESAAIVQYLSETFGDRAKLYVPDDTRGRAEVNEWCYFVMTELDAASLYIVRRHEGLPTLYGHAPVAVDSAKAYFLHNLEAMIPRIQRAEYLFSERLSTADILLMTCLDWASAAAIALPQQALDYQRRVAQRRAYQEALTRNFLSHPG